MTVLQTYLPQDRQRALAFHETLADRAHGAVLFADISGFTPLTEAFTRGLGARRGSEELTKQLNTVYDALIAEIEQYGGSVISFAGDAALCWFAESSALSASAPLRAVACAFALQRVMQQFAAVPLPDRSTVALAIKVAVTTGNVRRFVVGDANIRIMDVIAGNPVARSGMAEHLAQPGEVVIDAATAVALGAQIELAAWRPATNGRERFAVVRALNALLPAIPPPPIASAPCRTNQTLAPHYSV